MCSVCGIATDEPHLSNVPLVLEMLKRTRHRGPDACGVHASGRTVHARDPESLEREIEATGAVRLALAQSRLTITGNRHGRQPFTSADGKLALAHNGEIYNHGALRRILGDEADVESESDSEVLMRVLEHNYREAGEDFEEAMKRTIAVANGMYAIAATDGDVLILVRDAVGKKPLYYVDGKQRFAFASERKALVEVARAEDAPIRRLVPGEMLVHEKGLPVRVERMETLTLPAIDVTDWDEAVESYKDALERAIERRTRGLKKAACFFSGGVDSTMIAAMLKNAGVEVTGYVSGTEDSGDVKYAREVAKEMGIPLKVATFDEDVIAEWLPRILETAELHGPMMAEVSVPMFFAAKAAHEDGHRVIFSGQAADELWAGYDWYRKVVREQGHMTLHARLWEDVRALPIDCLEREDRITMGWSLEMRAPFLDSDVIRAAMRTCPRLKLESAEDTQGKRVHRKVASLVGVPDVVAYRLKVPAQDGASIHELLERVAARVFPGPEEDVPVADVPDFGSNYRYRDQPGKYGNRKVRALLHKLVTEGGFVVAGEDASAHAPPLTVAANDGEGDAQVRLTRDAR